MSGRTGIMAAILALAATPAFAGRGVGNSGDSLRLLFANAREHAAFITLRLQDRSLPMALDANLRTWILEHHRELAGDIAKTTHVWSEEPQATCAWTQRTPGADIEFSFNTCRQSFTACNAGTQDFDDAGELLVHESTHHLGINDESFADAVALAVFSAWRSGGTDWVPTSRLGAPAARYQESAVWTGSEVITFGGLIDRDYGSTNTGARYEPATDSWTALPTQGAPSRFGHQAIWTGKQMIIWGGFIVRDDGSKVWQNNGAVYDLASNSWTTLHTPYGPTEFLDVHAPDELRAVQTMVWTGKEALIYGGSVDKTKPMGGIYNPDAKTWRTLTMSGLPTRIGIVGHSAVWADDRMIVFGGRDLGSSPTNAGASFDPVANRWTTITSSGAPTERDAHVAVWTGEQMLVFGGADSQPDMIGTGGLYDPKTNSWKTVRTDTVQARIGHSALWTGSEVLVYGGKPKKLFGGRYFNTVGAFSPSSMSWRTVDVASAPAARGLHAAVWTGSSMIVLGGLGDGGAMLSSGGVFYP